MLFLHPYLFLLARPENQNYTLYFCSVMSLLIPVLWQRTPFFVFPMSVGPSTLQWPPPSWVHHRLTRPHWPSYVSRVSAHTLKRAHGKPCSRGVSLTRLWSPPELCLCFLTSASPLLLVPAVEGLALGLDPPPSMLSTHLNARIAHEAVVRSAPAQGLASSPQAPHQLNP